MEKVKSDGQGEAIEVLRDQYQCIENLQRQLKLMKELLGALLDDGVTLNKGDLVLSYDGYCYFRLENGNETLADGIESWDKALEMFLGQVRLAEEG